jgi:glutathione S-transferase
LIKLYFWPTPNDYKISILLEELGLPYQVESVYIGKGEQFPPNFLKISPSNKIPRRRGGRRVAGRPDDHTLRSARRELLVWSR